MSEAKVTAGSGGKRFPLVEEEAFVHLQRTADAYLQLVTAELKPHGLSTTQYNVLRILRGAGEDGLPCGEIAMRMINRDPDITRLLDRMEARGLVSRERQKKDRRVILARITAQGMELVDSLDEPVRAMHRRQLGHLGAGNLKRFIGLLIEAQPRSA